jgi:teichuronic acid biosynthesis glycosyltransferase TuaC
LVTRANLQDRVVFLGALSQARLRDYYGAVDALLLLSSREGWANVLLESMACATPVVATKVWGTPEVVAAQEAGILVERRVEAIVQGIQQLLQTDFDRTATRRYAEGFSWDDTSRGQYALFNQILNQTDTEQV